ncbi:MAG: hypothetical protein JXR76_03435 [Deltaproteobacteria bacterium]|nr:hypothetical protein [Deltaproteobacteria bacterium]
MISGWRLGKENLEREAQTVISMPAENSCAAVAFEDSDDAANLLKSPGFVEYEDVAVIYIGSNKNWRNSRKKTCQRSCL